MRIVFYNYFIPFRSFFKGNEEIETFTDFLEFVDSWNNDIEQINVMPVNTFSHIGVDVRFYFREFGRDDKKKWLLIGTPEQIEFVLSQNDKFLQNIIDHVYLPADFESLETIILKKINNLKLLKKLSLGK